MQNAVQFHQGIIGSIKGLIKDLIKVLQGSPSGFNRDSTSNAILIHVDSMGLHQEFLMDSKRIL